MYGFGSSTRDQVKKLFISQKHTLTMLAGTQSPGPAKYNLPNSVGGKQPDGRKADAASWSISSKARIPVEAGQDTPDFYNLPAAVGPQPDGKIANAPVYGFGTSTREIRARTFISQEHNMGSAPFVPTPGPAGPYKLANSLGNQPSSRKATSPRVSFAKQSRWAAHERELARNTVPGPGAYG